MQPITIPDVIIFVKGWRQSHGIPENGVLDENKCILFARELNERVGHMNFDPPTPGASYITSSNGTFPNGTPASEVAATIANHSNGKLYTKDDTEPGKLLHDEEFKQALIKTLGSEELANRILHGAPARQPGQMVPQKLGFWAQVRRNYAVWWQAKKRQQA